MKEYVYRNDTTNAQWRELRKLGFHTADALLCEDVFHALRCKFGIVVYNTAAPFVDPIKKTIMYSYTVKRCDTKWGWNCREVIGHTKWSKDIYAMKRQAIWIAIRYLKKKQNRHCKRLSISKK